MPCGRNLDFSTKLFINFIAVYCVCVYFEKLIVFFRPTGFRIRPTKSDNLRVAFGSGIWDAGIWAHIYGIESEDSGY